MNLKFMHADGRKIEEHDITLKKEVLLRLIASVHADFRRYFDEKEIDIEKDESNSLVIIFLDLLKMRDDLYLSETSETMEQVMTIQNKIMYIRDLVNKIGE